MSNGADATLLLHAQALDAEMDWLEAVLKLRLEQYFQLSEESFEHAPSPPTPTAGSALAALMNEQVFSALERAVLALALIPHLRPTALDLLFVRNPNLDRGYTEFGGWRGQKHSGFLPTGETAAFLVAGQNLALRTQLLACFEPQHLFARQGLLKLEGDTSGEPQLSAALQITAEALQRLQTGVCHKPDFNSQFPAKLITTALHWNDLVLAPEVMQELQIVQTWLQQGPALMDDWGLSRSIKPGYRCLFYGPPGTGKTLTATLLGQTVQADVYRIDLSMVVSKYIGETEKNLAKVFDQAQSRQWILFFDEADALFGKRTAASSSNDRHANQEIAYLLQRVEDFPGTVILASNLRANIDEAFSRRFQSMIYFPMPDASQRLQLWRGMLGQPERLGPDIDLLQIAERYELAGGAIVNVLRFAALQAARQGRAQLNSGDLRQALAKELRKEGKTL